MQITRRQLRFLIESVLNEEGTDAKGFDPKKAKLPDMEKTDIGDTFMKQQLGQFGTDDNKRSPGADIQAITDFRKGSDRSRFPALTFGPGTDEEGKLKSGKFTTIEDLYEPDDADIAAVERYKTQGGYIGDNEKSVDDPEVTLSQWDDEDTEETEVLDWGEEKTKQQYSPWEKTIEDSATALGDNDFDLEDEDEDDWVPEAEFDKPPTDYGLPKEKEKGFFANLKDRLFNMLKEEKNISRKQLRKIILAEIRRNNL